MATDLYELVERNSYSLVSIMSGIPALSLVISRVGGNSTAA
jgi:hypothetical protein